MSVATNTYLRNLCLSLPEATEEPHFENTLFRVKKKIFATYNPVTNLACVKLNEVDQSAFSAFDTSIVYPVPNKWGKQGWTLIDLEKVNADVLKDAIETAFCRVAPAKVVAAFKQNNDA